MNHLFKTMLAVSCWVTVVNADFLTAERVAVFEPSKFDPAGTQPSLVFLNELKEQGAVPSDWKVRPVFSMEDGRSVAVFPVEEGTDLYGTGEVTGPLRRNGLDVTLWNTDNYCYQKSEGKRLYQSHPWVMGVRTDGSAFGIIADSTWKQSIDLSDGIRFVSDGPAFRVIVIERESPLELQKALGELTGTMALPPLWALGFQQCRYSYFPDTRVKEIVDNFRDRQIPCDVVWMDIDYMDAFKIFTFDASRFPDPKGLNNYLHDKDFKAVYMIDPGVKAEPGYFVYDQGSKGDHWVKTASGAEYNGDVWPGACAFPDYTRPETRAWWSTLYKDFMVLGVDGVWNDMNEPAVFNGPDGTMPEDNRHRGGGGLPAGPHLRYHNVFGMLMVKASREGILAVNPDKRPFVLSRANFLGGQRYAATWTGDNKSTWEHMKMSIPMSLNLSLSGQPFNGPDIGGFEGNCNAELLGHWMALGAYYPFSRNHASNHSVDQEPWAFGEEIEAVCRTAMNRRYRLMPYLYTLFRQASEEGTPVMRPVFFADAKDPELRDEQQTFLLGGDLMIVPRWAANMDFPMGDWDRVRLEDADDGYQPFVLLRPGAIVPMADVIQSTEDYSTERITLLMNPDQAGHATGRLYDDAGNGFGYQEGDYAVHRFTCAKMDDQMLKVRIEQIDGKRIVKRQYRIGYVNDDSVQYSDWFDGPEFELRLRSDRITTVDYSLFPSMYVSADFNEWNPAALPLNYFGNGAWRSEKLFLPSGAHELLFTMLKDQPFKLWGRAQGLSGTAAPVKPEKQKTIRFSVAEAGDYLISFNQESGAYAIAPAPKIEYLSIVGSATSVGWNPQGIPLEQDQDNPHRYRWSGALGEGEFKFHTSSGDWGEGEWICAPESGRQDLSKADFMITTDAKGPDNKWVITQPGTYSISIDLEQKSISFLRK
ncbi:MAG: SusF/SusE family outer membrane protein [Pontiellaceae bacterium]|nr:SusF/SusE family outer membrane protein [Pontiellaceae bacterium]MBN2786433.1 SusF/SusE family outer membrane protein [Pontiellaceae bacterium]